MEMNNMKLIGGVGILAAATIVLSAVFGAQSASPTRHLPNTDHPNVVVFMVDDANVEDIQYMPEVQSRLVDQGVTFENNYSPLPMCCPARTTTLTGQYPHNTGIVDNVKPLGGFSQFDDSSTIGTWLNTDYRTGFIGKYLNQYGGTYVPPGWNLWKVPTTEYTYDYMNQHLNVDGTIRDFSGIYSTTLYGNHAKAFLNVSNPAPFFLFTSFVAPHAGSPHEADDPWMQTPNVEGKYRNTYTGPLTPTDNSFNEADIGDKRVSFQNQPLMSQDKIDQIGEALAQRRESLLSVDDQIAAVMDKINSVGEGANTYYIFVSDNGYFQGQHRIPAGKGQPYEADARVPLIIAGPGLPHGTIVTQLSGLQDLAPTILSMTNEWGSQNGAQLDGITLMPLATGGTSDRAMLLETAVTDDMSDLEASEAGATGTQTSITWQTRSIITNSGWKYTTYPQTNEVELYDLTVDPYEMNNLGRDPTWDTKQTELANELANLKNCDGVACRTAP
jgi:N-acetylglucosamine-6-sulfatase